VKNNEIDLPDEVHVARGQFSDSWVAILKKGSTTYYGYGRTETEARNDLIISILSSQQYFS